MASRAILAEPDYAPHPPVAEASEMESSPGGPAIAIVTM